MEDRDDYSLVRGYNVDPYIRHKPSRKGLSFTRDCAYCDGTGVDPGTIYGGDCPACKGTGFHTLKGSEEDYETCHRCDGTGKNQHTVYTRPCHICTGKGIVHSG
jgi:DnaJ-class molecular chaperone